MAHAVVDEAIRNVVAVGGDPDRVALLDNFSWGDPRRASTLGGLAAAVRGCCDARIAYAAPFVSGKDSLNNEYLTGADGNRHARPADARDHRRRPRARRRAGRHARPEAARQPLLLVGSAAPVPGSAAATST